MEDKLRKKGLELSYIEYRPILYKLAHKYKNNYNNSFDDALSDSHIWFIECYDSYDKNKSNFSTYLYHVIENKFKDIVRKNKRHSMNFVDIDNFTDEELGSYEINNKNYDITNINMTNGQMLRYNTFVYYQDFISVLDDRSNDIFKLYYFNNWSILEISDLLNISEIRVKQIKNNILNQLEKERKECLKLQKTDEI